MIYFQTYTDLELIFLFFKLMGSVMTTLLESLKALRRASARSCSEGVGEWNEGRGRLR